MGVGGKRVEGAKGLPTYRLAEVNKHAHPGDAWIVILGRVYDVTKFPDHPGGDVIYSHAGRDATDIFAAFHKGATKSMLAQFHIGDLDERDAPLACAGGADKPEKAAAFIRDIRSLRGRMVRAGMFKASPAYYVVKTVTTLGLGVAGAAAVMMSPSLWAHMLGALLLAFFWQQCGWLSHDYLHHQVFQDRKYGDWAGWFIGNVCQGFSVAWWKNKHNTHHAIPNVHESGEDLHDGDPDIDTLPVLAWSLRMAEKAMAQDNAAGRFFIKHQAVLYFPILLVARFSWLMQSFTFVFPLPTAWSGESLTKRKAMGRLEQAEPVGLLLYWFWYGGLMVLYMSPLRALLFLCASQMACGFLLALAFGVGHNGMTVYDADKAPDFGQLQISTTRDVHDTWGVVGWFMGGLNYQIEHHLFPSMPRHHLPLCAEYVQKICEAHGVRYHKTTIGEGTVEVLQYLKDVTTALAKEFPAL